MKLPHAEGFVRLLTDLLGRQVTVKPAPKIGATEPGFVGELVGATGDVLALTFSDRAFAAFVGAALALLPRNVADEAIRKGVVPPNLLENHFEVVNVATSLFNAANTHDAHVVLKTIHAAGPTLPAPLRARWLRPTARVDLVVDVAGYGSGRLTLVS